MKEMGEWLVVQGPGTESQWESVALYWCQSVCVVFPVLFSSMVSEGRQDMVKPRLSVNTEQQPQERQQLTVQRSEPCAFPGKRVPSAESSKGLEEGICLVY